MVHRNYLGWPIFWIAILFGWNCSPVLAVELLIAGKVYFSSGAREIFFPGDLAGSTMWSQFRPPHCWSPQLTHVNLKHGFLFWFLAFWWFILIYSNQEIYMETQWTSSLVSQNSIFGYLWGFCRGYWICHQDCFRAQPCSPLQVMTGIFCQVAVASGAAFSGMKRS